MSLKLSIKIRAAWKQFSKYWTRIIQVNSVLILIYFCGYLNKFLIKYLITGFITLEEFSEACQLIGKYMPNPMTQDQLVDICRLMDINKDGLVDLNEFLESFRLAERSLQYEDNELTEIQATWQELDRRPSRTAVDKDETGVQIEVLKLEDDDKNKTVNRNKNGQAHLMGESVLSSRDMEDIELIDCEASAPRRPGLLESDI